MNILKRIQILGLLLFPAWLMSMEGDLVINLPVQNNIVSAIESGITAGHANIGSSFVVPVSGGGSITAKISRYEYRNYSNSFRDRARDSRQRESTRYKISVCVDGVILNSLEWLNQIFATNQEFRMFFHSWLYSLSIHNSDIGLIRGSWFSPFKNLESLDLSGNSITGFDPADFRLPTTLTFLNLARNHIQNIPTELFQQGLPWLERLSLSENQISGLTSEMFTGLLFLHSLNLSNNGIALLPANLFHKVGELYPHFCLTILVCNNPISDQPEQVDMQELGFSKRSGNKIVFERVDDGERTPVEISLSL